MSALSLKRTKRIATLQFRLKFTIQQFLEKQKPLF